MLWVTDGSGVAADSKSGVAKFTTSIGHVLASHTVSWTSFCLWVLYQLRRLSLLSSSILALMSTFRWLPSTWLTTHWFSVLLPSTAQSRSILIIGSLDGVSIDIVLKSMLLSVIGSPLHHD